MQETQARLLSLDDVRASVRRLRRRGKRLVGRLRDDARQLVERSGKPVVDQVLALKELDPAGAPPDGDPGTARALDRAVVKELRSASRQVEELKRRVGQVERRLGTLSKSKPSKNRAA